MEFQQRDFFLGGDPVHDAHFLAQVVLHRAIFLPVAAAHRRDEDGPDAGGARLVDEARQVRA